MVVVPNKSWPILDMIMTITRIYRVEDSSCVAPMRAPYIKILKGSLQNLDVSSVLYQVLHHAAVPVWEGYRRV